LDAIIYIIHYLYCHVNVCFFGLKNGVNVYRGFTLRT
jgi:hypothetical protein